MGKPNSMNRTRVYAAFRPWIWYVVPTPVMLWLFKRYFNEGVVWQNIVNGKVVESLSYRTHV